MPNVNISRAKERHKKRAISVAVFELDAAEIVKAIAAGATNLDDFQLGVLPKFILILSVNTVILTPFLPALLTVDLGFAGGTELDAAAPLDGAANTVVAGNAPLPFSVQTGPIVTADFSANPTAGRAMVIIEYIEYNKATGELTKFVE